MKKSLIFISASMLLALSSCGSATSNLTLVHGDPVMNNELIALNLPETKPGKVVDFDTLACVSSRLPKDYTWNTFTENGLVIGSNILNNKGVYSLLAGCWIVPANYSSINVVTCAPVCDIAVVYDSRQFLYTMYDGFGNILMSWDNSKSFSTINFTGFQKINEKYYLTLRESYNYTYFYFEYDNYSSVRQVESLPSENTTVVYQKFNYGDMFKDLRSYDLSSFGIDGKLSSTGNIYTILYGNGSSKTFTVPTNTASSSVIGQYLVYQTNTSVTENATEFDYYNNGYKYVLTTYKVNLSNAEVTTAPFGGLITYSYPIYDTDKTSKYNYIKIKEIDSKKILGGEKSYIIDSDLVLHDDASHFTNLYTTKLSNGNYYDSTNKILYDGGLNILAHLSTMNPTLIDGRYFRGSIDGKYGAIDLTGKVIIPFEFDSIESMTLGNYIVVVKDGVYYSYNMSNGSKSEIGKSGSFSKLDERLFYKVEEIETTTATKYNYQVFTIKNPYSAISSFELDNRNVTLNAKYSELANAEFFVAVYYKEDTYYDIHGCSAGLQFKTNGTENKTIDPNNISISGTLSLNGTKTFNLYHSNPMFYTYTSSNKTVLYLLLKSMYYLKCSSIMIFNESGDLVKSAKITEDYEVEISFQFVKNVKYYIGIFNSDSTQADYCHLYLNETSSK